jgi:hypothetical protein
MRDGHRVIPHGLSVDGHRQLSETLQALGQQFNSLRTTIREAFGSASDAYQATTRLQYNLKALTGALEAELVEQHLDVPTQTLRGIYHHDQEV